MIICRTPLRISFFGGGTDYPDWYLKHGGAVVSTSINKYSYLTGRWLPPFFDYKFRIRYFKQEMVNSIDEIDHPVVRECSRLMAINRGFELVHGSDLPARSGLGSSSTFTVGVLHLLHSLQNRMPTKRELALQAINVEQNVIGETVGSQDQTAAAFGGFNVIKFSADKTIDVQPIPMSTSRIAALQENLLLCFTGFARTASEIAQQQVMEMENRTQQMLEMRALCDKAIELLLDESKPIELLGDLLNTQWTLKRSLSSKITSDSIDDIYDAGRRNGALGGKLLGAGGGGFMLFFAPKATHQKIVAALHDRMFVPFRFENTGSQIVYFSND